MLYRAVDTRFDYGQSPMMQVHAGYYFTTGKMIPCLS